MVKDKDGRLQEDLLVVHCFCMCSGSPLLGDLRMSRSVKYEFLSVLSYPRFLLSVFILPYCLLLGMSYCVT